MSAGEKYLFDRDFILEIAKEEHERKLRAREKLFSPEQIEEIKREAFESGKNTGFSEGREAGISEAKAEFDVKIDEFSKAIKDNFSNLETLKKEQLLLVQDSSVIMLKAILDRLFGKVVDKFSVDIIESFIKDNLPEAVSYGLVNLNVSVDDFASIEEFINTKFSDYNEFLKLKKDRDLKKGESYIHLLKTFLLL